MFFLDSIVFGIKPKTWRMIGKQSIYTGRFYIAKKFFQRVFEPQQHKNDAQSCDKQVPVCELVIEKKIHINIEYARKRLLS